MDKFKFIMNEYPDDEIGLDSSRFKEMHIIHHLNEFITHYNANHRFERNDNSSHAVLKHELAEFLNRLNVMGYRYDIVEILRRLKIFRDDIDPSQVNFVLVPEERYDFVNNRTYLDDGTSITDEQRYKEEYERERGH